MPSKNTLPDYITKHVHKIAKSEGFTSYTIETEADSKHGDNLVAIMTAITYVERRRKVACAINCICYAKKHRPMKCVESISIRN